MIFLHPDKDAFAYLMIVTEPSRPVWANKIQTNIEHKGPTLRRNEFGEGANKKKRRVCRAEPIGKSDREQMPIEEIKMHEGAGAINQVKRVFKYRSRQISTNKKKKEGFIFSRMQKKEKKEKYMYRSFWAMGRTKEKKSAFSKNKPTKKEKTPLGEKRRSLKQRLRR